VLVVVVLIGVTPMLISSGVGKGFVTQKISEQLRGVVSYDRLSLSWFGGQSITGLHVEHHDGADVAEATMDADIEMSLFSLITGGPDMVRGRATLDGSSDLRADGSLAVIDVLPESDEPISLAGLPAIEFTLSPSTFTINDEKTGETYAVKNLTGLMQFANGADSKVELTGDINTDGKLEVLATLSDGINTSGELTPATAKLDVTATISTLRIPRDTSGRSIQNLTITAKSESLTEALTSTISGALDVGDGKVSEITGNFLIDAPLSADGKSNVSIASITGVLTGSNAPTTLVEPFIAGYGIDTMRDIGDTADINVSFGSGTPKLVSVKVEAEHTKLDIVGEVDPDTRRVDGKTFKLTQHIVPALAKGLSNVDIDRPVDVIAELTSFSIPATSAEKPFDLRTLGFTGDISLSSAVAVTLPAAPVEGAAPVNTAPRTITMDAMRIAFNAPTLGQGVSIDARVGLDGGMIKADLRGDDLFNAAGELVAANARPSGTVTISNIPLSIARAFIVELPASVDTILDDTLSGEATFAQNATSKAIDVSTSLRTKAATVVADAVYGTDAITLKSATVTANATPELVAAFQADSEAPIRLVRETTLTVSAAPFKVMEKSGDTWALTDEVVHTTIGRTTLVLENAPFAAEAVRVRIDALNADIPLADPMTAVVKGTAELLQSSTTTKAADVALDLHFAMVNEALTPLGTIILTNLNMPIVEQVLGYGPGVIGNWTGPTGTLGVELVTPPADMVYAVVLTPDTPQLQGRFDTKLSETMMLLSGSADRFVLKAAAATRLLGGDDAESTESAESAAPPVLRVRGDVPLHLAIRTASVPRSMMRGEVFDPRAVKIDATIEGGPVALLDPNDRETLIDNIDIQVTATDFANTGVQYTVQGTRTGKTTVKPLIDLKGRLTNLVAADSTLALNDATSNFTANVNQLPTMLVDNIIGLDGLLHAAVGSSITAKMVADNFSRTSGQLKMDIDTPSSSLNAIVQGRDRALIVDDAHTLTAQLDLTPALRDRILKPIQPLLADIKSVDQPLKISARNAIFPLDGDLRRMNADISLTVGAVEFDSGSLMLAALSAFEQKQSVIAGFIDPITVRIRNGVVNYEKFSVTLGKQKIDFSGNVDLATKAVNINYAIPIESLAGSIKELRGLPAGTVVPFKTTGSIGNTTTSINVQGLAEAGIRGLVDDALGDAIDDALGGGGEGEEAPAGGLLEELLGGGRKKDDDKGGTTSGGKDGGKEGGKEGGAETPPAGGASGG
jgi:hypothetical protein